MTDQVDLRESVEAIDDEINVKSLQLFLGHRKTGFKGPFAFADP